MIFSNKKKKKKKKWGNEISPSIYLIRTIRKPAHETLYNIRALSIVNIF
jgi:hypothetical protein